MVGMGFSHNSSSFAWRKRANSARASGAQADDEVSKQILFRLANYCDRIAERMESWAAGPDWPRHANRGFAASELTRT
jgi:hypothetical protein